jgi:hypothetical protein
MRKWILGGIILLANVCSFADVGGGVGGSYIINGPNYQTNAQFNVSSGTMKNLYVSTITFRDNSISTTAFSGAGGGATAFSQLTDVDDSAKAINLVPKWNGSIIVWAAYNADFSFGIATFSDGLASVIEQGVGTWKAAGALTFTATYTNGPATGGYVSHTGWSNLTMTGTGYIGPTNSATSVSYPSVTGTQTFTLNATNGSQNPTYTITHTFYNRRYYGISTVVSGYTNTDVTALATSDLTNAVANVFTVTAGGSQYIVYAYPSRLGTAKFFVGGFEGGFNSPEIVSVTNASGFSENYYVYRSVNSNLGTTVVTVTVP